MCTNYRTENVKTKIVKSIKNSERRKRKKESFVDKCKVKQPNCLPFFKKVIESNQIKSKPNWFKWLNRDCVEEFA